MYLHDIIKMASSFLDKIAIPSYLWKTFVSRSYTSYLLSRSLSTSIEIQSNIDKQLEEGKLERHH